MLVPTLDIDITTHAREPYLQRRDQVEIVAKVRHARRFAEQVISDARLFWPTPSGPFGEHDLSETPRAFQFILVEGPDVKLNSWLDPASEALVPVISEPCVKLKEPVADASVTERTDEAYLDCDVRIVNRPARAASIVTLRFLQAGQRVPRIRSNPLD